MMFSIVLIMPPNWLRMSCWSITLIAGFWPSASTSAFSFAALAPPSVFTQISRMYGLASCSATIFWSSRTGERNSLPLYVAPTVSSAFSPSANSTGTLSPTLRPLFFAVSSATAIPPLASESSEPETGVTLMTRSMSPGATPEAAAQAPFSSRSAAVCGERADTPGVLSRARSADASSEPPLAMENM